jgi:hypothetical protein
LKVVFLLEVVEVLQVEVEGDEVEDYIGPDELESVEDVDIVEDVVVFLLLLCLLCCFLRVAPARVVFVLAMGMTCPPSYIPFFLYA